MIWKILTAFLVSCSLSFAATFYVDPSSGNNSNDGSIGSPLQTINYAITNKVTGAGDIVYLRGGHYSGGLHAIFLNTSSVAKSGTSNSVVLLSAYQNETPIVSEVPSPSEAIDVRNLSWWKFSGIIYSNNYAAARIENCTNLMFTNCSFGWMPGGNVATNADTSGYAIYDNLWMLGNSQRNKFINCTFANWGNIDPGAPFQIRGRHLSIGTEASTEATCYNLVQGCTFYHGGHDLISLWAPYNVIRSNYFHNEPFIPTNAYCYLLKNYTPGQDRTEPNPYGSWSARITKPGRFATGGGQWNQRSLWEYNTFAYTGPPADSDGSHCIEMSTSLNIYRNNTFSYALASGIIFYSVTASTRCQSNAVYNNVIFNCGLSTIYGGDAMQAVARGLSVNDYLGSDAPNFIVNNIFWGSIPTNVSYKIPISQAYGTNWNQDTAGKPYPLFVNTNGYGDYFRTSGLPDLRLQTNSPCINAGTWLSHCASAGSGTIMRLTNSLYFSDGNQIVQGDTIQLQGRLDTATVVSNDWQNNTLYLGSGLTWTNGQGVSLSYNGTAPDMGAFEMPSSSVEPPATQKLKGKSKNRGNTISH